jgi:hyperosmotically inducible periplasmic protein
LLRCPEDPMRAIIDERELTPAERDSLRNVTYTPPRRRWPGILAATLVGGAIAALAVSSLYDSRTIGERIDASVDATGQKVQDQVDDVKLATSEAARSGALVGDKAANALGDAGITAAVKTALAADPALSAIKIEVNTDGGVVSLVGPAPDQKARERAEVLAAAPQGVVRVDNRLVVVPGTH